MLVSTLPFNLKKKLFTIMTALLISYGLHGHAWSTLNPANTCTERHGMQVVPIGVKYYVVAGCGNRGGSPELTSIEVMN